MNNRSRRVAELIKHELADIVRKDFEFGGALVTIHEVDMTPDLKQAHVYVGIIGREDLQHDAMRQLTRSASAITAKLSRRVILKNTPSLHFKQDDSIERGVRVLNIIEQIDTVTPPEEPPYPRAAVPSAKPKSARNDDAGNRAGAESEGDEDDDAKTPARTARRTRRPVIEDEDDDEA